MCTGNVCTGNVIGKEIKENGTIKIYRLECSKYIKPFRNKASSEVRCQLFYFNVNIFGIKLLFSLTKKRQAHKSIELNCEKTPLFKKKKILAKKIDDSQTHTNSQALTYYGIHEPRTKVKNLI